MQSTFGRQVLIFLLFPSLQPVTWTEYFRIFFLMSPLHDITLVSKKWTKSYNLVEIASVQATMVLLKRLSKLSCM